MSKWAGRKGRKWRDLSARLKLELPPVCYICGKGIDRGLHHMDKWSWTLDHIIPLALGGDPYDEANLAPAHRHCNGRKGKGTLPPPSNNSRPW